MRKIIIVLILFTVSLSTQAQSTDNALDNLQTVDSVYTPVLNKDSGIKKLKTGVGVNMGYMVSSLGSGPEFSLSPNISYPLSGRLWLNAGIQAGYGQYMAASFSPEGAGYKLLPMTRMFIYASGNYKLSEKLVITGTAYKQVFQNTGTDRQQIIANYINNGLSVGFNYKIGSNVSFGAQIHINSRNNYMPYGGLYPQGGMYNPYAW